MTSCGEEGTYLGLVAASHFFLLPRHHCNLWGNLQIMMSFISAHRSLLFKKKNPIVTAVLVTFSMKQVEFSIPLGRQRGEEGGSWAALAAHRSRASNCSSKELLQLLGSFSSPPIVRVKIQWLEKPSCSATKVNAAAPCRCLSAAPERLLEISPGIARFIRAPCAAEGHKGFVCSFLSCK